MTVSHVVILAEEPSMEAALRLLVPKVAPGLEFAVKVFQGKHDLLLGPTGKTKAPAPRRPANGKNRPKKVHCKGSESVRESAFWLAVQFR